MPKDDSVLELVKRVNQLENELARMRSKQLFTPPTSISTALSQSLTADSGGGNGYTYVNLWSPAAMTLPAGQITRMRVTFQAAAGEALTITNAYIGHGAITGDSYDFMATPVQLLFSGAASIAIPAGGTSTSDLAVFSYNKANNLLVSWYLNGGAAFDGQRYATGFSNTNNYYRAATNEAGTVNKTAGYTAVAGQNQAISQIESNGF